jgi:RNA polymerase sigma-70 factor (ECF subfamily)
VRDEELLQRLRAGDEQAFSALVDRFQASMIRLAQTFVSSRAVAEEVVQDTWLGVVKGIDRFEGRSSLQTWLYRILVNRARTTGVRESRTVPVAEPAVDPARFAPDGTWATPPDADDRLAAVALAGRVRALVEELPAAQRQVVTMRDIDGLSSTEVCSVLDISEGNQRVLLHRGRSRLRARLEAEQRAWEGGDRAAPA